MKKFFCKLIVALALPLFGGCSYDNGSSANPPSGFTAAAGDGRVVLTWAPDPNVDYWLFTATDPSLTAFVWTNLPNSHAFPSAVSPYYMCGLLDDTEYWFAINGRIGGGAGGPSSATISATPYITGSTWIANPVLTQDILSPNLYGAGYASLATCSNNTTSASGSFAAVGANGAIFTSADGTNWASRLAPPGFSSDLYAVAGYAANLNNPLNPALRWVAVGAGGVSLYSVDGITWAVGRDQAISSSLPNPSLRSLTEFAGTFFAAGDAGTILSSTDGINWIPHTSGTINNLNGVAHGGIYVAVGDSGTILTSIDGNTWITQTSGTANNLRQVSSVGKIYVAVGDAGTIVTSKDRGATWAVITLPGMPNLSGVAAESRHDTSLVPDPLLGFTPNAQFVAVDSAGNTYTSPNGITWSGATVTGASNLNALVSSGFGYVAAGNAGVTLTSF